MLAAAAQEIGAGHLIIASSARGERRVRLAGRSLQRMAAELATSRRRLERSTVDLERKHHEVEGRRRYIETILERIATGVVSIDAAGRISTINSRGACACSGSTPTVVGQPRRGRVRRATILQPFGDAARSEAARGRTEPSAQEVAADARRTRELHLAAVATRAARHADGSRDGTVLVVDDVTPLIRAQKVAAWREVARRLAHEIKNPLTPIQLSAERLRRHFGDGRRATRRSSRSARRPSSARSSR